MKKKLALLMAAMMTVSLVPVTAFASTKLTAVDEITTGVDDIFTSRVELKKDNDQVDIQQGGQFDVYATLTNGKFAYVDDNDDNKYQMEVDSYLDTANGVKHVDVINDTKAKITLDETIFNQSDDAAAAVWKADYAANWKTVETNKNQAVKDWKDANPNAGKEAWEAQYIEDHADEIKAAWKLANPDAGKEAWEAQYIEDHADEIKDAWVDAWLANVDNSAAITAWEAAYDVANPSATPEQKEAAKKLWVETKKYPAEKDTEEAKVAGEKWTALGDPAKTAALDEAYTAKKTEAEATAADDAWTALGDDDPAKTAALDKAYEDLTAAEKEAILNAAAATAADKAYTAPSYASACVLPIIAKAVEKGEVVVTFTSNVSAFKKASEVIATAVDGDAEITVDGVKTFVEDSSETEKTIKDISINGLSNGAITRPITLKLKGNFKFASVPTVTLLNDAAATANVKVTKVGSGDDELLITFDTAPLAGQLAKINISNLKLKALKKCDAGDVATITVSSDKNKDFSAVKLEVAKMVEEAVTYSVEDDDLPVIWAGKNYKDDEANTLKVSVEENTGDILNTSRKATFTFPEGIEVVDLETKKGLSATGFKYEIDENVVTIYNYQKGDAESKKTDFDVNFILNAAPTFSGDVEVTLGGQFDDVTLKVATVKAPYTIEAKTTDVLIDYRYVPVNNIVITEAEDGIFDDKDVIALAVEKMDFEDAGDIEVTEGNIEADVDIEEGNDKYDVLKVTIKDSSTEASTMVISGLELYLDRTLPVGGYALKNIAPMDKDDEVIHKNDDKIGTNILWENSSNDKDVYDDDVNGIGIFKYKEVTINDEYVNVITAARDQDDSMTTKKIIITVGATTMTAGTETITLDAPAYINAENYTMLPLRAITEAFGATVNWDNGTRTVTILSGQRIISMTIGSKTMYINGTPVAMNTAPEIAADRTFVPVRDLANSLGISNVNWTEASGTVTLN